MLWTEALLAAAGDEALAGSSADRKRIANFLATHPPSNLVAAGVSAAYLKTLQAVQALPTP